MTGFRLCNDRVGVECVRGALWSLLWSESSELRGVTVRETRLPLYLQEPFDRGSGLHLILLRALPAGQLITHSSSYMRTRELNVHVAGRNGHVAGPAWAVSAVPSYLTASSGAGAHVMDAAAGSDALCGLGGESRESASGTAG